MLSFAGYRCVMGLKAVLVCFFLLFFLHSFSQSPAQETASTTLTGLILDSATRQPVEYATISMYREDKSKTVNGALSNAQGRFKMEVTQSGVFSLLVESIGYLPLTLDGIQIEKNGHKVLE